MKYAVILVPALLLAGCPPPCSEPPPLSLINIPDYLENTTWEGSAEVIGEANAAPIFPSTLELNSDGTFRLVVHFEDRDTVASGDWAGEPFQENPGLGRIDLAFRCSDFYYFQPGSLWRGDYIYDGRFSMVLIEFPGSLERDPDGLLFWDFSPAMPSAAKFKP